MFRNLLVWASLLVLPWPVALAQGWTVTRLLVGGAEVTQAELEIRQAERPPQTRQVHLKEVLPLGIDVKARPEVEIVLVSPGGMRARKETGDGGILRLSAISAATEQVEIKSGTWGFQRAAAAMGEALKPFSFLAGSGKGSTPGTEFTVAVDESAGVARFVVQQGRIHLSWPEQVLVQTPASPDAPPATTTRAVRRVLAAGDPAVSVPLNPSGWLMRYTDYNEALATFAAQLREAESRQDADAVFEALLAQAEMLVLAGRAQEALAPLQRAQDLVSGPGPDDTYWRAVAIGQRGAALQALNRYGDAARAFAESRALHDQVPPREGERGGLTQMGNLAINLLADGAVACADTWAARLLARLDAEQAGPVRHVRAPLLGVRGDSAFWLQRLPQARQWHAQALAMQKDSDIAKRDKAGRIASPAVAQAMITLGMDHTALGRFASAEELHRDALAMAEGLFAAPHPLKADARQGQADLQLARRRPLQALALADQALAMLDALPNDAVRRADVLTLRGQALLAAGRAAEAVDALREARQGLAPIWPDASHPRFDPLLRDLARALRASGAPQAQAEEAEQARLDGRKAQVRKEAACPR